MYIHMYMRMSTRVCTFSSHFHITLGSLWDHFGYFVVISASRCGQSGITLATFWCHSGLRGCPPPPRRNRELAILFYFRLEIGDYDWKQK